MTMPAITRGTKRYCTGSVASAFERVELLGDAHRADLRGHRRADAAGHHQPHEHRRQLAQHRQRHDAADEVLGVHAMEAVVRLQRHAPCR